MLNRDQSIGSVKKIVVSIWEWFVVITDTIILSFTGIVLVFPITFIVDWKRRALMHRVCVTWAHILMALCPVWRVRKVIGKENVQPKKRYVIVCNHQSMLDIPVLLHMLPMEFKFLAKKELFHIPFFGWQIALTGYIPINRSSHESGRQALEMCRQWLRKGVNVVLFPEGTRSLDGEIQRFKTGAFKLAHDERMEILPVVIDGTRDAIPKKSWKIEKFTDFFVSIGKPIRIEGKGHGAIERAREGVREEMRGMLAQIRSKGASSGLEGQAR